METAVEQEAEAPVDLEIGGWFDVECLNPDGSLAWHERVKNGTTNVAIDDVLGVYLSNATRTTAWYLGLIDNAAFASVSSGDTMGSHAGWAENQNYTESVRQTWTPGAVSAQVISNPTSVTFSINATVTIRGVFLTSSSTKGGTTGILFATGLFSSAQSLVNGQLLKVTYTCTGSGS